MAECGGSPTGQKPYKNKCFAHDQKKLSRFQTRNAYGFQETLENLWKNNNPSITLEPKDRVEQSGQRGKWPGTIGNPWGNDIPAIVNPCRPQIWTWPLTVSWKPWKPLGKSTILKVDLAQRPRTANSPAWNTLPSSMKILWKTCFPLIVGFASQHRQKAQALARARIKMWPQ